MMLRGLVYLLGKLDEKYVDVKNNKHEAQLLLL